MRARRLEGTRPRKQTLRDRGICVGGGHGGVKGLEGAEIGLESACLVDGGEFWVVPIAGEALKMSCVVRGGVGAADVAAEEAGGRAGVGGGPREGFGGD